MNENTEGAQQNELQSKLSNPKIEWIHSQKSIW